MINSIRSNGLPRPEKTPGPGRGPIIPKEAKARRMRLNPTPAEALLQEALVTGSQGSQMPFKAQVLIHGYILDWYCADARLAIEADGGYHQDLEQAQHDALRDERLAKKGIRTLRFTNAQILEDPATILDEIATVARSRCEALHSETPRHRAMVEEAAKIVSELNHDI